jgi:PAS domain S-box-containing protein
MDSSRIPRTSTLLRDQEGRIVQWCGLSVDIDEGKKAEHRLRRSEAYLAEAQRLSHTGSAAYNETEILYWSEEASRIWGFDQLQGVPSREAVWQRIHPDDLERVNENIQQGVREKRRFANEFRIVLPDGTVKHLEATNNPVFAASGELLEIVVTGVDVTEHKLAEQALREREAKIRRLVDANIIGIFFWDFDGRILEANEAFLDILGYDQEDLVAGRIRWTDLTPPEWRDNDLRLIQQHGASGTLPPFEKEYFRKDGSRVPVLLGVATFEEGGTQGVAFVLDLTERKRAEQAVRESELKLRKIIETVPSMLWSTDPDGEPTRVNQRILDYAGMRFEDFLTLGWKEFLHPDDFPETARAFFHAIQTGEPYQAVHRLRRIDGQYRWHHARGEPLRDSEQRIIQWYGLSVDIDERKRAEDALRESEAKFRDYAETASDWFWEIGPDYKFTLLTGTAFGSNPAQRMGTMCWDHALDVETEPEKWRLVWAALDARESFRDFVYCTVDGRGAPMHVKASGKPVFDSNGKFLGYRGTGTDVTAIVRGQRAEASLRTVQAELAHVSRVMTLGQLTASIAHEVNQPIGSARNYAEAALNFLNRNPPEIGEVMGALDRIVAAADRAGGIVDRIRDQIKKAPPRNDRFDLNRAIEEVIGLAQSMITENGLSVQRRLASGMAPVHGDRVQLQQVVLNLILNAVEAMSSVEADERELLISTDQSEANGTLVAVRDSGPGIDSKHLELIFDAFYSTKSGMGMGLSICRSIVAAHGGRLWAATVEPRGALFQFTLPSAEARSSIAALESSKKTLL